MRLRDLIVVLDDSARSGAQLELAAWLARRHDAHLTGLCLLELLVRWMPGYTLSAYADAFAAQPLSDLRARARESAAGLEAKFLEVLRRDSLHGNFLLADGPPAEAAVRRGRGTDLILLGQRNPDEPPHPRASDVLEDLLMETGRPLLIVPYAGDFRTVGSNVLIGWNDSAQSARAAHDVLPLLDPAAKVTVVTVQRPRSSEADVLPGAAIAEHLARHGVNASAARTINDGTISDADALLSYAADLGADMLAVGGYGHSRRREVLLGGVTRALLDHMTLPVLLSH